MVMTGREIAIISQPAQRAVERSLRSWPEMRRRADDSGARHHALENPKPVVRTPPASRFGAKTHVPLWDDLWPRAPFLAQLLGQAPARISPHDGFEAYAPGHSAKGLAFDEEA